MEEKLYLATKKALTKLGAEDVSFVVERPGDMAHGDYAINAALAASKALEKNPREIAESLILSLQEELGTDVSKVEVAGPGFVNITVAPNVIAGEIIRAAKEAEKWGRGDANEGKRVMVEYTQPNPFKVIHIGHLMSNTIGESVSRFVEFSGASIARANYQGDVGPHVAKALWGLQQSGISDPETSEELGKAYTLGHRAYEEDAKAKAEIDAINKSIYVQDNPELMERWRKGRDISLAAFEKVYKILGTKFDYYFFESETAEPGTEIVRDGIEKGVFEESEGAVIYNGEKKGLHTLVFITSKGTPTYEAKEIGLAFLKEERWPSDLSLITTSTEQIGHFKVVKAALEEIAPLLGAKTFHIPHGFLRLSSGKMSSREGNIITAESLIADVLARVAEKNPDPLVANQVGIAAIKYSILKAAAGSDIIFDFDQSLSLEGDSGPYLQYATVRAQSILSQKERGEVDSAPEVPYRIERMITRFPEIAARSERERAPHHVTQFLTQLASEWNSFYAAERILGGEHEAYKLRIAQAFVNTMKNGLWLLGIEVPQKM